MVKQDAGPRVLFHPQSSSSWNYFPAHSSLCSTPLPMGDESDSHKWTQALPHLKVEERLFSPNQENNPSQPDQPLSTLLNSKASCSSKFTLPGCQKLPPRLFNRAAEAVRTPTGTEQMTSSYCYRKTRTHGSPEAKPQHRPGQSFMKRKGT